MAQTLLWMENENGFRCGIYSIADLVKLEASKTLRFRTHNIQSGVCATRNPKYASKHSAGLAQANIPIAAAGA